MYKAILFDLDGTLTESGEGITKCVQYALEKLGKPEENLKKLEVFIGPPLKEQFMKYAGLDEETISGCREYAAGIKTQEIYPGGCIIETGRLCETDSGSFSFDGIF